MKTGKSSLYSLFFAIFNDSLGWGIVLTIFAPLLFDRSQGIVPSDYADDQRIIIIGFLIGSTAFSTLIIMPVLGALSDVIGRRKVLLCCLLGSLASYVMGAIAIEIESLVLLFASRLLAGAFSRSKPIARIAISDLSTQETKAKNFAIVSMISDAAFIVGPPLGGFLANSAWGSLFNYATPMWFIAFLFLANFLWSWSAFEETYVRANRENCTWMREIMEISKLSQISRMKGWMLAVLFFLFGFWAFELYYPTYFTDVFQFDAANIGRMSGYFAVWWFVGSFAVAQLLKTSPSFNVLVALPIAGLGIIILSLLPSWVEWLYVMPIIAICSSVANICLLALLSNLTGVQNQGKVLGVQQSFASLARMASPIFAGYMGALYVQLPLMISGLILIATFLGCLFIRGKR